MNNALSFEDWVRAHGQRTELALDNLLDAANTNPVRLHEAMRYAAQGGGKRRTRRHRKKMQTKRIRR